MSLLHANKLHQLVRVLTIPSQWRATETGWAALASVGFALLYFSEPESFNLGLSLLRT